MYKKRPIDRIDRITELINTIWKDKEKDDLRFFQFISWLEQAYSEQNGGTGRKHVVETGKHGLPYTIIDLFYLEDDKLEEFLIELVQKKDI